MSRKSLADTETPNAYVRIGGEIATEHRMARTLSQIETEIEKLKKEAQEVRAREIKDVIGRIKEAIAHYGITPRELFGKAAGGAKAAGKRRAGAKAAAKAGGAGKGRKAARARTPSVVKYRDEAGHTWSGRGKRPNWFKDALAAGKKPEELLAK